MIKDLIRLNLTELQTNTFSTILSVSLGSYEILELDETRSIREKTFNNEHMERYWLPTNLDCSDCSLYMFTRGWVQE